MGLAPLSLSMRLHLALEKAWASVVRFRVR